MYDNFKDEILKELGPLDPDWFNILTAQTLTDEGCVSDQDDLCGNQEGHFKTPLSKSSLDSQLFSTPKVFRHDRLVSPETEDERSFTADQESPCLFQMSKDHAKQIPESLGAQIHPDISWTSSLNTPPAVPSTLILCKLFPSLSNTSRVGAASPNCNDTPHAVQNPKVHDSPQSLLNESDSVWRQKLPDAIEDGEIRSTVASVLEGAENVLSIFFTNSNSTLRKVKTDRIKRKQIIPTKEHDCSSNNITATNNAVSSRKREDNWKPVKLSSSPPMKTGDIEITQWSPLNLSEIPSCTVDFCHDNSCAAQAEKKTLTEQQTNDSGPIQLLKPPLKITDSVFAKKKRKFIYTIETSKKLTHGKETKSPKTNSITGIPDSGKTFKKIIFETIHFFTMSEFTLFSYLYFFLGYNVMPLGEFSGEADSCSLREDKTEKEENEENLPLPLPAKKARQANLQQDCNVSVNNRKYSINEGPVTDSGFQSAFADTTHLTITSSIPSSKNISQTRPSTGCETDIHMMASFLSTNTGNAKSHLDILQKAESDAKQHSAVNGRESKLQKESNLTLTQLPSSAKRTSTDSLFPRQSQVTGSFPEKTIVLLPDIHASGFKTASNKGIQISSDNLERAKRLLEDNEADRHINTKEKMNMKDPLVKNTVPNSNQSLSSCGNFGDSSCQLTASQKADVTELCTLLEEADSQFEFTQYKSAKLQQYCLDNGSSSHKVDKELDPDFLTGIDFDDSFSSGVEKNQAVTVMLDKMASVSSGEPKNLDRAGLTETSKQENENPMMPGVRFKTPAGNVLQVSKCLSKAKALFADLEEKLTDQKSPDKPSSKVDAKTRQIHVTNVKVEDIANDFETKIAKATCQSGFQMASGKGINISEQAMQAADAFFKDCNTGDSSTGLSITCKKTQELSTVSVSDKRNHSKFKNGQGIRHNVSEDPIGKLEKGNAQTVWNTEITQPDTEMKDFSMILEGTASGKNLSVSVDAMKKAQCLFDEVHTFEDTTKLKPKGDDCLTHQNQVALPKSGGFQTASGKGVVISSAALEKAKSLLSDYEAVEKSSNSKMFIPGLSSSSNGFLAASGKSMSVSAKSLQKAKALFSDITCAADILPVSDIRDSEKKLDNAEKIKLFLLCLCVTA
uniref:BRCA2 DNA repair associated n=1 Tax=Echeneis naucrates TaxID=173247 RepID=A0A665VJ43_ECHNA